MTRQWKRSVYSGKCANPRRRPSSTDTSDCTSTSMPVSSYTSLIAISLGEFGATITFVSNIPGETRTLPLAIYTYTQVPGGEGPGLRLVLISVVVALMALAGAEFLNRALTRRIGVSV